MALNVTSVTVELPTCTCEILVSDVLTFYMNILLQLYRYPLPKELTLCTCHCLSRLSNIFFWRGGGGQAGGEDLIDTASLVVAVLTLHVHACLRVEMFDCGLESCKQTNHNYALSVFHLSVLKSNSVVTVKQI